MKYQLFSEPQKVYDQMLKDIRDAKKYIFLETYIYDNDEIGRKFREVLIKKAKEGVVVRLLLDGWGPNVRKSFFRELIAVGGQLRFFKEFQYVFRIFAKNHERNHRKLLIIDNKIAYIGSANITADCLKWRELVLRLEGGVAIAFARSFNKSWNLHDIDIPKRIQSIIHEQFEIINDIPSRKHKITEHKYTQLIKKAKHIIRIETPYFIPSGKIKKQLALAVKRGVRVIIILPKVSDVKIINIARNLSLGELHEKGVEIRYYNHNLHSKLLIVDDNFFLLGSSNLDYRSFIYQYEINFIGRDKGIIRSLIHYFNESITDTTPFNYSEWKHRSSFKKLLEKLVYYVRDLL